MPPGAGTVEVMIMAIVRWDPFGEAMRMQRDMDRIFSRLGGAAVGPEGAVAWMPKVDVKRKDDDIVVRAELPGIDPGQVDVEVTDGVLTIRGERRQEEKQEGEDWLVCESCYGSFERSLTIPESVDVSSITAEYKDGILEVHVPKALEAARPKTTKIEIAK
jgi:HSP20 family protein